MTATIRPLDARPFGVHLWLAQLDDRPLDGSMVLSAPEWSRAAGFVFEADRRRYLAAHDVLREVLATAAGVPRQLEFEIGHNGKPALPSQFGVGFSLSHSQGWALVGVSAGREFGVDIETRRPVADSVALLQSQFHPDELAERPFGTDEGSERFLCGWTRKEACLKAVGVGLSLAPSAFAAGLFPEDRQVTMPIGGRSVQVHVVSVDLGVPLVAAVACVVA